MRVASVCRTSIFTTCLTAFALLSARPLAAQVPSPEAHFGFRMGTDGRLASAEAIERYFELVAARSDRVQIVDIGPTTEGHRTIAARLDRPPGTVRGWLRAFARRNRDVATRRRSSPQS